MPVRDKDVTIDVSTVTDRSGSTAMTDELEARPLAAERPTGGDAQKRRTVVVITVVLAAVVATAGLLMTRDASTGPHEVTVASASPADRPEGDAPVTTAAPAGDLTDPALDMARIEEAFQLLYDPDRPDDLDLATIVDDPAGVAAASEAGRHGPFAEAARHVEWRLLDIELTGPDRAVVRYALDVPPGSTAMDLSAMSGSAVLHDGRWKVTRETICSDLALGGAPCA